MPSPRKILVPADSTQGLEYCGAKRTCHRWPGTCPASGAVSRSMR
jgi:hypothetical protein